jgi:hypothetical protein
MQEPPTATEPIQSVASFLHQYAMNNDIDISKSSNEVDPKETSQIAQWLTPHTVAASHPLYNVLADDIKYFSELENVLRTVFDLLRPKQTRSLP